MVVVVVLLVVVVLVLVVVRVVIRLEQVRYCIYCIGDTSAEQAPRLQYQNRRYYVVPFLGHASQPPYLLSYSPTLLLSPSTP